VGSRVTGVNRPLIKIVSKRIANLTLRLWGIGSLNLGQMAAHFGPGGDRAAIIGAHRSYHDPVTVPPGAGVQEENRLFGRQREAVPKP
jgi:hypothetical protein